jgi:hypothetical protein
LCRYSGIAVHLIYFSLDGSLTVNRACVAKNAERFVLTIDSVCFKVAGFVPAAFYFIVIPYPGLFASTMQTSGNHDRNPIEKYSKTVCFFSWKSPASAINIAVNHSHHDKRSIISHERSSFYFS